MGSRGAYIQGRRRGSKSGGADIFNGILRAQVYAVGVSPWASRGVWGHAPPEHFGNLDTLRRFLMLVFETNFNTAYNENHHGKYNNIYK